MSTIKITKDEKTSEVQAQLITSDAKVSNTNNFKGLRFPNLAQMFKDKSVHKYENNNYEENQDNDNAKVDKESNNEREATTKSEDVNSKTSAFIKRRRQQLELQRLMSITAAMAK